MFPHEVESNMDYTDSQNTLNAIISDSTDQSRFAVDVGYLALNEPVEVYDLTLPVRIASPDQQAREALDKLVGEGLIVRRADPCEYTYKTSAIRHGLMEEGFALEAYKTL